MTSTDSVDTIDIDLEKLWLICQRRWLSGMLIFLFSIIVAAVATSLQEVQHEATGKLLFKINRTPTLTGVGEEITDLETLEHNANPIITEIEVIESFPIAEKTIRSIELTNHTLELTAQELKKKLTVKPVGGADVLTVSYQANNPELAVAVVNQLMETYIENTITMSRGNVVDAQKLINEQLPQAKLRVDRVEEALQNFKEKHQIAVIKEQANAAVATMTELEQQIAQVQTQLQQVQVRSTALQEQMGMDTQKALTLATLSQSTGVQEALRELQQVQSQLAEEKTRFQELQPSVIRLREEEAAFEEILQQRIREVLGSEQEISQSNLQRGNLHQQLTSQLITAEIDRLALASELEKLQEIQSTYQQRLNKIPRLERENRDLERQLTTAQSTYETLLKRFHDTKLAEQQNIGNVRIIESAQVKVKNKTKLNLLLGATLGVLFAISTMAFLELMDSSLKTIQEIQHHFAYPLLGTIPIFSENIVSLPVVAMPHSISSESFRILQAKLKLFGEDKSPKVIVVSSALPQEGKSVISANLALTLAQTGQKTLIIDADLRHNSQQDIWQTENKLNLGLSDVILEEKDISLAIKSISKNLDLLLPGNTPDNPLSVFESQRMQLLLSKLAHNYDFIFIDSPPLLGVADTLSLGKIADTILLVSRLGLVDDSNARECQELLKNTKQNIAGLVINGVGVETQIQT